MRFNKGDIFICPDDLPNTINSGEYNLGEIELVKEDIKKYKGKPIKVKCTYNGQSTSHYVLFYGFNLVVHKSDFEERNTNRERLICRSK